MRPEGGQHDRCGILSREEERADDRGEGAVQGKVVPLHSISKAQSKYAGPRGHHSRDSFHRSLSQGATALP